MQKKSKILNLNTKKQKKSDDAVVGIVAAFLIIGLVVAVFSVIQTQYVPKWMREKESDHMDELADQFAQLNYAIRIHSSNKESDIPISTGITLGSKEMPYLMSMRAFGRLSILQDSFFISINSTHNYSIGTIKYSSINSYFINQEYVQENGGIILSQDTGNAMLIKPIINATYEADISIDLKIIDISTMGNKVQSIINWGTSPIQTEFKESYSNTLVNISYINITTNYNTSWYNFINSVLLNAGLNWDENNPNYEIILDDNKITIHFFEFVTVNVNYYKIGAQIAPGWVEERD